MVGVLGAEGIFFLSLFFFWREQKKKKRKKKEKNDPTRLEQVPRVVCGKRVSCVSTRQGRKRGRALSRVEVLLLSFFLLFFFFCSSIIQRRILRGPAPPCARGIQISKPTWSRDHVVSEGPARFSKGRTRGNAARKRRSSRDAREERWIRGGQKTLQHQAFQNTIISRPRGLSFRARIRTHLHEKACT